MSEDVIMKAIHKCTKPVTKDKDCKCSICGNGIRGGRPHLDIVFLDILMCIECSKRIAARRLLEDIIDDTLPETQEEIDAWVAQCENDPEFQKFSEEYKSKLPAMLDKAFEEVFGGD